MIPDETVSVGFPKIEVPPCFVNEPAVLSSWRYEYRREAQEIVPGVWIGPLGVVRNDTFLVQNNIRVLVSLMSNSSTAAVVKHKYMNSPDFHCLIIDPGHSVMCPTKIVSELPAIVDAINYSKTYGCGALLFCETGNSASAVAAAAYLIDQTDFGFVSAIQYVQSKRFSVHLNNADIHNLETYEALVRARPPASVVQAGSSYSPKKTRSREADDECNEHVRKR